MDGHALAQQVVDVLHAGVLQRHAAGDGGVHRADDPHVLQSADLLKAARAGVAVEHHVGGGHGHVNLAAGHVLHILEGTGGSLRIALHALDVIGPQL